jgi:hypothetical protein
MDHSYIDANSVAERYLEQQLSPEELRQFEEHIVDCQECSDRLLLAEMFHARNGRPQKDREVVARVVVYKPRRVLLLLAAAGAAVPLIYFCWALISRT